MEYPAEMRHSKENRVPGWPQRLLSAIRPTSVWSVLGIVISIAIVAVSATVLIRILRGIDFNALMTALRNMPAREIWLALLCVVGGYITLTFYDLFALRTIGRNDVPYRIAALAGFSAYSIGHNLGATAVTCAAVRYHVYSARGLQIVDVAKVCFVTGLTFWLGNVAVLGLAIAYDPTMAATLDHLSPQANRTMALGTLAGLLIYVAWVWQRPRTIGRVNWSITLPDGPLSLLQIGIGFLDLLCCALAMYLLLPAQPEIPFAGFAVIFVGALLLGFISHAPGSIGVFDAAMLVALDQFDKAELLAGLLLYRLIYFIIPFAIALALLAGRAVWLARQRNLQPISEA
jgi:uncharacterized membrane protein YbhN (UPF0104 family)